MKLSTNSLLCTTGIFTTEELALKLLELSPSTSSTVAFLASIEYPIQAAISALKALPWEQPSVTTFGFADVVSLAGKRVVRKPISGMGSTSRAIVEEKEGEVQVSFWLDGRVFLTEMLAKEAARATEIANESSWRDRRCEETSAND